MHTITINLENDQLVDKVIWLLKHFEQDGLEIVAKEDLQDLKLLRATRKEQSIPFDEYLNNEN